MLGRNTNVRVPLVSANGWACVGAIGLLLVLGSQILMVTRRAHDLSTSSGHRAPRIMRASPCARLAWTRAHTSHSAPPFPSLPWARPATMTASAFHAVSHTDHLEGTLSRCGQHGDVSLQCTVLPPEAKVAVTGVHKDFAHDTLFVDVVLLSDPLTVLRCFGHILRGHLVLRGSGDKELFRVESGASYDWCNGSYSFRFDGLLTFPEGDPVLQVQTMSLAMSGYMLPQGQPTCTAVIGDSVLSSTEAKNTLYRYSDAHKFPDVPLGIALAAPFAIRLPNQPRCSVDNFAHLWGRWIRRDICHNTRPVCRHLAWSFFQGEYAWVPYECALEEISPAVFIKHMAARNVTRLWLVGDSLSRNIFSELLDFFASDSTISMEHQSLTRGTAVTASGPTGSRFTFVHANSYGYTEGPLQSCWSINPEGDANYLRNRNRGGWANGLTNLNALFSEVAQHPDVLLVSEGAHYMQWSMNMSELGHGLSILRQTLEQHAYEGKLLVRGTTPLREATLHRRLTLRIHTRYNNILRRFAQHMGAAYMDTHDLVLSRTDHMPDEVHLIGEPADMRLVSRESLLVLLNLLKVM